MLITEIAKTLNKDELDELYESVKDIKDPYFFLKIEDKKRKLKTHHTYLEIERVRKNNILKSLVGKTVKVQGVVSDARLYSNSAIFCLSPCIINGEDIGHTWVKYSPEFKNIKLGSEITFYSRIKKYKENSKSGVDWEEIDFVRITGGDNSSLHNVGNLTYVPLGRGKSFSYRQFAFQGGKIINTLEPVPQEFKKLLFFEWLVKLEYGEYWSFTMRSTAAVK